MKRLCPVVPLLAVAAGLLLAAAPAWAWWPGGHGIITRAAALSLPPEVPSFFRTGGNALAHYAVDPDVAKNRAAPNLSDQESPEHYIDFELLAGKPLPPTRYEYLRLCFEAKIDPKNIGLVPYAIAEGTERLAVDFAEYRRWPGNPFIQQKCLVDGGRLAHYAEDMAQPLHTSIHHDGRAAADGTSPRSGIHNRVDALVENLKLTPQELAKDLKITPFESLFPAILKQLAESHDLVDRVYMLESRLPAANPAAGFDPKGVDREVAAFTTERARAAARFVASLYLTAWERSKQIVLPPWLEREPPGPAAR